MPRLRKVLKYLALTVGGLMAAALIANAIFVWRTSNALEDRLSKLRAGGEPLSLPELGMKRTQPGPDAAAVLKRIEPELRALSGEINLLLGDTDVVATRPESVWTSLQAAYDKHPTVLPALEEAAACPSYRSPLNYQLATFSDANSPTPSFQSELLPWVQSQREVANLLKYRIDLQLREKHHDGAMRTCLTGLRIARHAAKEPTIIANLVVIAVRSNMMAAANDVLRAGPVAAELHADLEAALAPWDSADAYRWSLRSERAYGLQIFDEMYRGVETNHSAWFARGFINNLKCAYIDQMAEAIKQADNSFEQFQADNKAGAAAKPDFRHALSVLIVPAIIKLREADFRDRCLVRSMRVLNALTAKKLTDAPASLADLSLPVTATTDPYTDKSLIVKRLDGQWLIYGVGKDLTDDGGKLDHLEDVGYGPAKLPK